MFFFFSCNILKKPSSSLETFAYLLIPLGTAFQSTYPTPLQNSVLSWLVVGLLDGGDHREMRSKQAL